MKKKQSTQWTSSSEHYNILSDNFIQPQHTNQNHIKMTHNSSQPAYPNKTNFSLLKNTIKQQRVNLFAKNVTPVHPDHSQLTQVQANYRYNKVTLKQQLNNKIMTNSTPLYVENRGLFRGMKYSSKTNKIQNLHIKIKSTHKTESSLQVHQNNSNHSLLSPKLQATQRFIKRSYSITQHHQVNQAFNPNKATGNRILRTKSLQSNQTLSKLKRVQLYNQRQRIRLHLSLESQKNRYKNEKLNILAQEHLNIIKKLPNYLIDRVKIKSDVKSLGQLFENMVQNQICITRYGSHVYKTLMGQLIFYIGYELYMKFVQDYDPQQQSYQLILSNFFQIYLAMRFKAPLLVLECYLNLIQHAISNQNYDHAQRYSEKCLIASIYYNQKYYQQRCVQKISMCEYYKGNVCQATYLHDNNGQLTANSIKQLKEYYNEQQQIDILFHHLYEVPKFSIEELLKDYEERMDNYKSIVVFKSPRIGPQDSFQSKKQQLRIDLRTMERLRQFKKQAEMIRKQVKRHENLFTVRNRYQNHDKFKLIKRNLVINQENESSQVLKVHQSLNRIKRISTKSIRTKLYTQFVQFLKKIQLKFSDIVNN